MYVPRHPVAYGQVALNKLQEIPHEQQAGYTLLENFKLELQRPGSVRLPQGVGIEQVGTCIHAWCCDAC